MEKVVGSDRRSARWLGLRTAILVVLGWDLLILGYIALGVAQGVAQGRDPLDMDLVPAGQFLLAFTAVAVLAAAPGGWVLGPEAAVSVGMSRRAVISAMALGAVLIGDAVLSVGFALAPTQGDNAFGPLSAATVASLMVSGGVIVGPFVFAFVTLPSAAIWTSMVGRAWWRSHSSA